MKCAYRQRCDDKCPPKSESCKIKDYRDKLHSLDIRAIPKKSGHHRIT